MATFTETFTVTSSLGGQSKISRSGATRLTKKHSVPAGQSGVVTSVATTAVLTLAAGHGITTANKVGVFWAGGQRLDMVVTAVDTTTITVTAASGVGTALPSANTAIVVSVQTLKSDVTFAAANLQMMSVSAPGRAAANFLDNSSASLLVAPIADPPAVGSDGESFQWAANTGITQPISATVYSVALYNGLATAQDITIGVLIA